jgi:hypothetical protein
MSGLEWEGKEVTPFSTPNRCYKSMSRPKRNKKLQVMMNEKEYQALAEYAARMGLNMSEIIRDFIKGLETYE